MNLREFQKKWDEMCLELIATGKMVPREKLKNFPKENSARDDMVTIGAIFMPRRINHEETKKKWRKYHRNRLRKENTNTGTNPVSVIAPYWDSGTWVFDDERVGLVKEPFVSGVPDMIDHLVRDIPNARDGFRMTFSASPFPGHTDSLEWSRAETGGNWYKLHGEPDMEGWLCPALFKYFESAPGCLYVKADSISS